VKPPAGNRVAKGELVADFGKLGLCPGDIVLVHSSLSSIGYVEGGADTVVDALLEAVDPGGTVVVPTLTGSPSLSPWNPPVFDPSETPCWTGAIPEALRRRPEAVRSRHPTHSVAAIGPRAREITEGHEDCLTPCGPGSPYYKISRLGGRILLLGVGLDVNTTFHCTEELAGVPNRILPQPVEARIVTESGVITRNLFIHNYFGPPPDFSGFEPFLKGTSIVRRGKVGKADCLLLDSGLLVERTLSLLRRDIYVLHRWRRLSP